MENRNLSEAVQYIFSSPDKTAWKTTTSHLFKIDILKIFWDLSEHKNVIEIGSAQGHSTGLLSRIFNKVLAIDINEDNCRLIKEKDLKNVVILQQDLYSPDAYEKFKSLGINFDIAFIDALHTKEAVISDTNLAIKLGCKTIVYDDFGLCPEVKEAIKEICSVNSPKNIRYIGLPPTCYIPSTNNKLLLDWEGVVLDY
jgi:tRNA A58 N-methylase Trm61